MLPQVIDLLNTIFSVTWTMFSLYLDTPSYGACIWKSYCWLMNMTGRVSNRNWRMLPKHSVHSNWIRRLHTLWLWKVNTVWLWPSLHHNGFSNEQNWMYTKFWRVGHNHTVAYSLYLVQIDTKCTFNSILGSICHFTTLASLQFESGLLGFTQHSVTWSVPQNEMITNTIWWACRRTLIKMFI